MRGEGGPRGGNCRLWERGRRGLLGLGGWRACCLHLGLWGGPWLFVMFD